MIAPGVPRQSSLSRCRIGPVAPVAERCRDDRAGRAVEHQLRMTGHLGLGHRELHVREQTQRATLFDVPFGFVVGRRRRRADDVEPELGGSSCELGGRHERIVPVKAIRIHEEGGPDVLRYEDVPDPEASDGEVLVRLAAASLNHLDVWVRMGLPSVPKPRILGADGAGVVAALGAGVGGLAVGDRVVLNPGVVHDGAMTVIGEHRDGTHCELIAIDAEQVFHLDDLLSFEEAAAFPLVFETAYRMLVTKAAIREGEWVLIWGIGGGVSTAALEIARALGARTIVTSGSDEKLAQARSWGADLALNHHTDDVVKAVKEATGKGVDVVIESVGEATWARSLAAAAPAARIVVCGATSGPNPPAALHRFWWKELTVFGSTMGSHDDFVGAYDLVRSGRARVHVDRVFPLAEAAAGHARLESGEQLGKIVFSIP
jgi:zinc-binding alcohol dehydrogenase/oxidoreductase